MEKLKQNYDRVLLIVVGLIALVAGSMLIMKSFAIGQKFPGVDEGSGTEFEDPPAARVAEITGDVDETVQWDHPKAADSEKIYRLFASVPIVWKDGTEQPIDLFDENTPVREGVSNKYLMDNKLPYYRDDVLAMDPDGDGFSNLEEYELGPTDPNDKNDYPDATHKLELTGISETPYLVMFSSVGQNEYGFRRTVPRGAPPLPRDQRWPSTYVELNQSFPESGPDALRFKLLKFEETDMHIAATSQDRTNVPVATIEDSASGKEIKLIKGAGTDIPIHRATFSYDGPGGRAEFAEKERGDSFKLDGAGLDLRVVDIDATEVSLEVTEGGQNPRIIKRSLNPAK